MIAALGPTVAPPRERSRGAVGSPARAVATVADLLAMAPVPELLCRLLLAETLGALCREAELGRCHGLLTPSSLRLAGAPPARLVSDCPRDPRVQLAGCGEAAAMSVEARRAAVAALGDTSWVASEARGGAVPSLSGDLYAIGAIVRALLGGTHVRPAFERLLEALGAARPETRPSLEQATARARELALEGLAAWQRTRAPEPPVSAAEPAVAEVEPPRLRPRPQPELRRATFEWTPPPDLPLPRHIALPITETMPRAAVAAPAVATPPASPPLWLVLAPTAAASLLSALLAAALLFGGLQ